MSVRLRVKDGTRPDTRLCDTCSRGMILKGSQQGQEMVVCRVLERSLPFPVVECSRYSQHGEMDEYQAREIGWVLEVQGGKTLGFKPPKKEYK